MAKQPVAKGGTSRIRFIMLEADIPEGDLNQITSAIQNALKPTTTIIQQRLPPEVAAALPSGLADANADINVEAVEPEEETSAEQSAQRQPRESRPRKPTVPKVLNIDLNSGVSFENYVTEHAPKSEPDRHLVVLAWFKQHRPTEAVTVNHV